MLEYPYPYASDKSIKNNYSYICLKIAKPDLFICYVNYVQYELGITFKAKAQSWTFTVGKYFYSGWG